jgi:hypothetical protein
MMSRRNFLKMAALALLPVLYFGFSRAEQEAFTAWGQTSITFAQLQTAYKMLG